MFFRVVTLGQVDISFAAISGRFPSRSSPVLQPYLVLFVHSFSKVTPCCSELHRISKVRTIFCPTKTAVVAATELVTQPVHLPHPHYPGPWSLRVLDQTIPDTIASFASARRQAKDPDPCFPSRAGAHTRCPETLELRHTKDEVSMSERVAPSSPPTSSSGDFKPYRTTPLQARTLPPIQDAVSAAAPGDSRQWSSTAPSPLSRPFPLSSTPPDQRPSRPIGVQNLLNPAGQASANSQPQRGNGSHSDSPPTPSSLGPTSRGATPAISTTSGQTRSPIEASVPQVTPPSINAFPVPMARAMTPRSPTTWPQGAMTKGLPTGTIDARQSPFVVPRDEAPTTNGPALQSLSEVTQGLPMPTRPSYGPGIPQVPSMARQNSQDSNHHAWPNLERHAAGTPTQGPPSRYSESPRSTYAYEHVGSHKQSNIPPAAPTGQPQSFFTGPFTTSGPASTMSQPSLSRTKAFDMPTSSTTAQSQYQIMTLETEQGPIQVPVDVQAASKVADEKRKRNATASHRFRQRRKEKERETSENIAKLEAQIREMTEEKDHYQKERDFFQDFVLRHRIPLPPRPPSPRRKRHATMSGGSLSQFPDHERDERDGRQTRRRTSAYMPPTGTTPLPSDPPALPQFDRISSMPSEHIQGANRIRPQNPYPPAGSPYHQSIPR